MVSDSICVEKRRIILKLRGVPVMVGGIRRLILVSHVDYICLDVTERKVQEQGEQ